VLLVNSGNKPLDVSPVAVQGQPDFTVAEAACPTVLRPGEDCAATVAFTPVSTGPRTAQLLFGGRGPAVPMSGAGARPPSAAPDIAPRALDFGDQLIGGVSSPRSVTVTNRADKPLRLKPAADTTTGAFRLDGAACTNRDVRPGARCDVAVTFAPTIAGQYSGVLLLAADGFPDVAVVLRGFGVNGQTPPVPDVIGKTLAQAGSELGSKGFVTGHIQQVAHPDIPKGSVADQLPRAGFPLSQGGAVDLFVSTGPKPVTVPDVVGLTESEASGRLASEGIGVGAITLETDPAVPRGQVLSSRPPAGTTVAAGTPVDLTVSAGDERPTVPDVRGLTESTATARIIDVGLVVGAVSRPYDESIAEGVVISSDPVADTRLDPGKPVNLVVSAGQAPVTVPEVVGRTESEATAEIEHVGLQVGAVTREADCSIPENEVLRSTPAGGTAVKSGTSVGLNVSSGAPMAIVPEVAGRTQADATSALQSAGFQAEVTMRSDESIPAGVVITSEPTAGSSASTCGPVHLMVSSGPPPVPVPPVVGRVEDDAETLLAKSGLRMGAVTAQTSCEISADVVISSNPEPGTNVSRGTHVALVVSSGEPQATVPDVVNHSETEARSLLEQAGFQVGTVTKQVDPSMPNGAVISSTPGGNTTASTCHPVDLVVSEYVEVPDVVGKSESDATDMLMKAGLKVTVSNEDACEIVDASDPVAGTRVAPGTSVTIYLCGSPSTGSTSQHQWRPTSEGHRS
jgi:beta-lactam-binding protein with PASTA domain